MKPCHCCRRPGVAEWLDLGPQPVSNRYLRSPGEVEYVHPIALGVCRACGLVQLDGPVPADEVRPRFDWISYNEPEGHLDCLADDVLKLPGLTPQTTVCGISYLDDSTLRRFRERGLTRTWLADLHDDLGAGEPMAGIETIQQNLTPAAAEHMIARYGRPQVVLMRRILEHAHDLNRVLTTLRALLDPAGYLILEVPDACRALEKCDFSTVWEEHVFYFTPATLRNVLARTGFETVYLRRFPYTHEDSLVAIVRPAADPVATTLRPGELEAELARAERFIRQFPVQRGRYLRFFEAYRRERGPIAFLGAGHLSCALINYYQLGCLVEFVADDHPNKKGLFMPGSRLPIRGSEALVGSGVKLCCMSVRPEIESRVVEKNQQFLDGGGSLASIFPDSVYALPI